MKLINKEYELKESLRFVCKQELLFESVDGSKEMFVMTFYIKDTDKSDQFKMGERYKFEVSSVA